MATLKQKTVARLIIENATLDNPLNDGEIVEKSRYSKSMKIKPSLVIKSKGVQEELKVLGFDETSAKEVVSEIMLNRKVKPEARLKATDQVFKVVGAYAPEKSVNLNISIPNEARIKSKEAIKQLLNDSSGNN